MRHSTFRRILTACSAAMLVAAAFPGAAEAGGRYSDGLSYVDQDGRTQSVKRKLRAQFPNGSADAVIAYAPLPPVRAVPVILQPEPVAQPIVKLRPAPVAAPRLVLRGTVSDGSENWPSGRTCCRPGQPYADEQPG
jgi:hypothetical protein